MIQAFPPGELLFVKPEILGLGGIDFNNATDGVIVEHMWLRPAGMEVRLLLFHLVQKVIDHGADQRERADGLPLDSFSRTGKVLRVAALTVSS